MAILAERPKAAEPALPRRARVVVHLPGARAIYRPPSRWSTVGAIAAAVALHALAALIVGLNPEDPVATELPMNEQIAEVVFESGPAESIQPEQTDEEPLVAEAPPPLAETPEFVEEAPTPPPDRRRRTGPVSPLARPRGLGIPGQMSMSGAKAVAISAPRPEYPYEARRSRTTGSGVVVMTVDPATGAVTDVSMTQSTSSPILDNAAVSAFRRWRFRAGTVTRVRTPITFTMTGAQY